MKPHFLKRSVPYRHPYNRSFLNMCKAFFTNPTKFEVIYNYFKNTFLRVLPMYTHKKTALIHTRIRTVSIFSLFFHHLCKIRVKPPFLRPLNHITHLLKRIQLFICCNRHLNAELCADIANSCHHLIHRLVFHHVG